MHIVNDGDVCVCVRQEQRERGGQRGARVARGGGGRAGRRAAARRAAAAAGHGYAPRHSPNLYLCFIYPMRLTRIFTLQWTSGTTYPTCERRCEFAACFPRL